jgi:ABC-type multidrug transport system fused ATPase/permease subunit
VIEHGPHAVLLAQNGAYRRMHDLQFGVPAGERAAS